jgi:hypothetical protein
MNWCTVGVLWKRLLELVTASQGHELLHDVLSTTANRARDTDDVSSITVPSRAPLKPFSAWQPQPMSAELPIRPLFFIQMPPLLTPAHT